MESIAARVGWGALDKVARLFESSVYAGAFVRAGAVRFGAWAVTWFSGRGAAGPEKSSERHVCSPVGKTEGDARPASVAARISDRDAAQDKSQPSGMSLVVKQAVLKEAQRRRAQQSEKSEKLEKAQDSDESEKLGKSGKSKGFLAGVDEYQNEIDEESKKQKPINAKVNLDRLLPH